MIDSGVVRMALLAVVFTALSCASTIIDCASGVPDVTTLTGVSTCSVGSIVYGDFTVSYSPNFSSVGLSILSAEFIGSDAVLHMQFRTNPTPVTTTPGGWVSVDYEVWATGPWMDFISLSNVDGKGIRIFDTACKLSPTETYDSCTGDNLLASISAGTGESVSGTFTVPVAHYYLSKFIQFDDAWVDRVDQGTGAPEPTTMVLLGSALLGSMLVGMGRRSVHA